MACNIFSHREVTSRILPVARAREEQEVLSAARAMVHVSDALDAVPDAPLTEAFIAAIHRVMTAGIDYEHNTPGVYRGHAVSAGTYVPPRTHDEVTSLMAQFARWLHGPAAAEMPPAVRAIAAHFYFVSIHPFGDGNGRTARAIESFLLYQAKINALGFYSLSNFYYQHRDAYIAGLDEARFRTGGDLTPFIVFSLQGLVDELNAVHEEVLLEMSVIAFRDFAQQELLRTRRYRTKAGERMYELVTGLLEPIPLATIVAGRHPLSTPYRQLSAMTLRRDVAFLRDLKLIVVENGSVRANVALMNHA